MNRYTYAGNNPLIYTDPTGHLKLGKLLKSFVTGVVAGAVFVLSGGSAAIAAGAIGKAMLAGMAAGAAAAISPVLGYGMLAGGAVYATATGGLDGLAYYAAGVFGGYIGASGAQYAMENWGSAQTTDGISSNNVQTGIESQKKIELDTTVNHSNMQTFAEWQSENTTQVALGPFGPGLKNVRPTDPYAFDFSNYNWTDPNVQWMMSPIRSARPGVFAGGGLQGLYGGYRVGSYLNQGVISPVKNLIQHGDLSP